MESMANDYFGHIDFFALLHRANNRGCVKFPRSITPAQKNQGSLHINIFELTRHYGALCAPPRLAPAPRVSSPLLK